MDYWSSSLPVSIVSPRMGATGPAEMIEALEEGAQLLLQKEMLAEAELSKLRRGVSAAQAA